jgi:uncharacterized protein YbjT (DUF2867 family)
MTSPSILVVGPTGTVGREVINALGTEGHRARALVRNPAKASLFDENVEIVIGDLSQPETLAPAFRNIEAAFIVAPPSPELEILEANAFEAARRAGVKQIVYLSNFGAGTFGPPVWDWHGSSESRLQDLKIPFAILRPARFMTDTPFPFSWMGIKDRSVLAEGTGEGKITMIDPRDIGAVAAKILTAGGHEGKTYELTSADILRGDEIAQKIGAVLGKDIRFVKADQQESRSLMTRVGIPGFVIETVLRYYETVRENRWYTTAAVADILGRAPRSYDAWLREKAEGFFTA